VIVDLLASAGATRDVVVPACEPWTVHDLVSHLAGVCADVLAGNLDGVATEPWTQAQVARGRERAIAAVIDEWTGLAPKFAELVDAFPGWYGHQAVADITVHEHDVRGALGLPGDRHSGAVVVTADFLISTRAHPTASASGLGPLAVETDTHRWTIGSTHPRDDDPASAMDSIMLSGAAPCVDVEPRVSVRLSTFELVRALSGRRSAAQIRQYEWDVDPEPFVPMFAAPPFHLRRTDLSE
jgi:hypothetical protein